MDILTVNYKVLLDKIRNELSQIHDTPPETFASLDGVNYIPIRRFEENATQSSIPHNNQVYQRADFQAVLKVDENQRFDHNKTRNIASHRIQPKMELPDMKKTVSLKEHLTKLVLKAEHKAALDILYAWTQKNDPYLNNQVLHLSSRFNALQKEIHARTIDPRDAKIAIAQITQALIDYIEQLPSHATITIEEQEIESFEMPTNGEVTPRMPPKSDTLNILMFTANPSKDNELKLEKEHSCITTALQNKQECFILQHKKSINLTEFKQFTETIRPDILHFSGHAESGGDGGLTVHNEQKNDSEFITPDKLEVLFDYFNEENILFKAVILNACFSEEAACVISKYVPYVIGTTISIGDTMAIHFSEGFYFKLVETGSDFERSYKSGRTAAIKSMSQKAYFVMYKNGQKMTL
jgi:Effector-associated domain 11